MARSKNLVLLLLLLLLLIVLFSCQGGKTNEEYLQVPFLHEHKGTANYEVIEIADWGEVKWDSIGNSFLALSFDTVFRYALDGSLIDSISEDRFLILDDPYSFQRKRDNFYTTWFYDGDKTVRKFIQLFSEDDSKYYQYEDEKEFKEAYQSVLKEGLYTRTSGDTVWTKKDNRWFRINLKTKNIYKLALDIEYLDSAKYVDANIDLYDKASIVRYTVQGNNYYKIGDDWYTIIRYFTIDGFKKIYPEKLPPPRLQKIETKQNPPEFVRQRYFPSKKVKANSVLGSPSDFTLGSYIISIGLPGGDTLTYRRLGDGLGNLSQFYQLPASKDGTDSVLFISQRYNNQKGIDGGVYFSHGGLFMIRPKQEKVN